MMALNECVLSSGISNLTPCLSRIQGQTGIPFFEFLCFSSKRSSLLSPPCDGCHSGRDWTVFLPIIMLFLQGLLRPGRSLVRLNAS